MAKFYVQSGTFRRVVAADCSRKAALWAVHEVMQQIMPVEDTGVTRFTNAKGEHEAAHQVTVLAAKVRVDERGFDRQDASELSTMEVVAEWNQMVMTLDRLQQMLDGTGGQKSASVDRLSKSDFAADDFADDRFSDDLAA